MIVYLYRKYISESFRERIYNLFLGQMLMNVRNIPCWLKGMYICVLSPFFPANEYYDSYRFIGKHGVTFFPFKGSRKYKTVFATVFRDEKLPYVEHHGKRLYFPEGFSDASVRNMYRRLLLEQDVDSAHRYINSYEDLTGKTLLDMGAAEGIFALDAIEYVKKVYLFECDAQWINPLHATFKPWKEKVEIVQKYVGDVDSGEYISVDSFLKGKEQDGIHLKMDIEGFEQAALKGARNLLTSGKAISGSVCTYHKEEDAKEISSFLESLGYAYQFTQGYLYMSSMRKAMCRFHSKY